MKQGILKIAKQGKNKGKVCYFGNYEKNYSSNKNFKKRILVATSTFPSFLSGNATSSFVYELSKRLAKNRDLEIVVSTPYY